MSKEEEPPYASSPTVVGGTLIVGRYRVDREIGHGGMATVYLARDLKHDRQVALKIIHSEVADRLATERFRQEIALLANLQHPHILPLYDSGDYDGALFFVMPFIAGESLRVLLDREGQLSVDDAIRIAREVADALAHAHTQNIIHRDIKPENILLSQGHALVGDFGIARAVSRAGARRLTDAGFAIGTLAYMSPEQASGDTVDGRADLYSLGCVIYEMLTGRLPYEGATAMAVLANRASEAVRPLRGRRPAVPLRVESALMKALASSPSDRFKSVADFSAALQHVPEAPRSLLARVAASTGARLAVAVVGVVGLATLFFAFRPAPLDPKLYVVMPFVHRARAAPELLDGDNCQQMLYQAFGRWDGITLVDDIRVHDARARAPSGALTLEEALRSARSLHAGRLAWGEVWVDHGKLFVRGLVYDVSTGRRLKEYAVALRPDLGDAEQRFSELADTLLLPLFADGRATLPSSAEGVRGTNSIGALTAYVRAHEALAAWQLDSAQALFQAAIEIDPAYPHANYWLAQVKAWRGDDPTSWLVNARTAMLLSARLSRTDSAISGALLALAEGEFGDACARYSRLAASADSLNFAVWYGLGDCRARDTVVVQSAASPSGWRFRSGYESAIRSYVKALTLVPSAYRVFTGPGFERLETLLFTDVSLRRGAVALDSAIWVAYPSLSHDTLAFVPYRYADIASGRAPQPASTPAAIARNRAQLQKLAVGWVQEFPRSPLAYETLARTLEEQGHINGVGGADVSALSAVNHALTLSMDAASRRRLRLMRIRLLLMSSQFADARALADSALAQGNPSDPVDCDALKALAALTGRVQLTVALLQRAVSQTQFLTTAGEFVQPPLPVAQASLALFGYVSLGAPKDSIQSSHELLDRVLESYLPKHEIEHMRDATEHGSLQLAYPATPVISLQRPNAPGDYLLAIQRRAALGDSRGVHELLDATSPSRKLRSAADLAIPLAYQEAWILLEVGDSAGAMRKLDASLNSLPALGPYVLDLVANAGFLVRAMALRSDLAASHGDADTARRWGVAVVDLWGGADPSLQSIVDRMRARTR